MQEISYRAFSLRTHQKNCRIKRPSICQFELTFKCGLHCRHCYSDCYNRKSYIKRELSTKNVKYILDKVYNSGAVWLCLTGGDPLTRPDFLKIYSSAKDRGFIITIFTNGYSLTKKIADYFQERPPFVIEITLNAVTKKTYENISQVEGSFERAMDGIDMILKRDLPLKIKTQVTKDNLRELPKIKRFVEGLGLQFRPSFILHARLNGDLRPCHLRIAPDAGLKLNERLNPDSTDGKEEELCAKPISPLDYSDAQGAFGKPDGYNGQGSGGDFLFSCVAGRGGGITLDPYGNMVFCSSIRKPALNLLKANIEDGLYDLFPQIAAKRFTTDSKCRYCQIRDLCCNCPGNAFLEKQDMEAAIDYFCKLAHLVANQKTVPNLNS